MKNFIKGVMAISLSMLAVSSLSAQGLKVAPLSDRYQLEALGMSANHRYVTGLNIASYRAFVWNTEDDTIIENEGDYANCDFRHVTDDGRAFGIIGLDDMVTTNAAWLDPDGKVNILDEDMSACYDVTPDGKIAVGCLLDIDMWWPTACVWNDGVRTILPCPSFFECGIDNDGANAQFVSADGKVIAGYLLDNHSSRPAIIWRLQDDGTYAYEVISEKYWELNDGEGKPYREFQCLGLSQDGKWLCVAVQEEGATGFSRSEKVARLNLETNELEVANYPETSFYDGDSSYPSGISNDGTVVGTIVDEVEFRRGFYWRSGSSDAENLADAYPQYEELAHYDGFMHSVIGISADARYIVGYGLPVTIKNGQADYDFVSYLLDTGVASSINNIRAPQVKNLRRYNLYGQPVGVDARGLIIEGNKLVIK